MGDESDADWDAGLIEWGIEDAQESRPKRTRKRRRAKTNSARVIGDADDKPESGGLNLKLEVTEEWCMAAAEREGNCEIGAGFETCPAPAYSTPAPLQPPGSSLVEALPSEEEMARIIKGAFNQYWNWPDPEILLDKLVSKCARAILDRLAASPSTEEVR